MFDAFNNQSSYKGPKGVIGNVLTRSKFVDRFWAHLDSTRITRSILVAFWCISLLSECLPKFAKIKRQFFYDYYEIVFLNFSVCKMYSPQLHNFLKNFRCLKYPLHINSYRIFYREFILLIYK